MEYLLNLAPINTKLRICKIEEVNDKLLKRFSELGIIVGQTISIISKPNKQNIIVCVRGYLLALDEVVSSKVVVYV